MRSIKDIIIHCADTPDGKEFHASDIDDWHVERGFRRQDVWRSRWNPQYKAIGYHYVITLNGNIETGRHLEEVGAHCQMANANSVGICMIGKDKFTAQQWSTLARLLSDLRTRYLRVSIRGHREYASAIAQGKKCPNFDVESYVADGYVPDDKHILEVDA